MLKKIVGPKKEEVRGY